MHHVQCIAEVPVHMFQIKVHMHVDTIMYGEHTVFAANMDKKVEGNKDQPVTS